MVNCWWVEVSKTVCLLRGAYRILAVVAPHRSLVDQHENHDGNESNKRMCSTNWLMVVYNKPMSRCLSLLFAFTLVEWMDGWMDVRTTLGMILALTAKACLAAALMVLAEIIVIWRAVSGLWKDLGSVHIRAIAAARHCVEAVAVHKSLSVQRPALSSSSSSSSSQRMANRECSAASGQ